MSAGVILVVNAGSSRLKFSLFHAMHGGALAWVVRGKMEGLGTRPRLTACDGAGNKLVEREFTANEAREAIRLAGAWLHEHVHDEPVIGVGHRVAHCGAKYTHPVVVDEGVYAGLEHLVPLAPLHQPQVACFDTPFHRTHSQLADMYALPWDY